MIGKYEVFRRTSLVHRNTESCSQRRHSREVTFVTQPERLQEYSQHSGGGEVVPRDGTKENASALNMSTKLTACASASRKTHM